MFLSYLSLTFLPLWSLGCFIGAVFVFRWKFLKMLSRVLPNLGKNQGGDILPIERQDLRYFWSLIICAFLLAASWLLYFSSWSASTVTESIYDNTTKIYLFYGLLIAVFFIIGILGLLAIYRKSIYLGLKNKIIFRFYDGWPALILGAIVLAVALIGLYIIAFS